jgi:hypothetical protein
MRPPRASVCSLTALTAVLLLADVAYGFKWHECPTPPVPLNPSRLGATQAPFIHPGHELRIVLNAAQIAASGGFSLEPDGNRVEITFASLFGEPVVLAPRRVTAVSAGVLEIGFPDTAAEVGRGLAGPVGVRVAAGDRLVAEIASKDLVALPPANDVTEMLLGSGAPQVVLAALSARGDLWLPVRFSGEPMEGMPGCEGNFVLPTPVTVGAATTQDVLTRGTDPLRRLRRVQGYLGDMVINGTDFYGMYYREKITLLHLAGTLGVSICRLNDAADLVLRVKGSRAWARSRRSPMRQAIEGSRPLVLRLRAGDLVPARTTRDGPLDSFGNACTPLPDEAAPSADEAQLRRR